MPKELRTLIDFFIISIIKNSYYAKIKQEDYFFSAAALRISSDTFGWFSVVFSILRFYFSVIWVISAIFVYTSVIFGWRRQSSAGLRNSSDEG